MSRISLLTTETAQAAARSDLEQIHAAFGSVPHMFRAVAHSPAALRSLWGSFGALGSGTLPASLTEQIAVAVANRNGCDYCLAAHTALGRKAGLSAEALTAAQSGHSQEPRTAAALRFTLQMVEQRGAVSGADLQALREAGFDDQAIVEIIAHIALNLFTNYVNIALDVAVDFPKVALRAAA